MINTINVYEPPNLSRRLLLVFVAFISLGAVSVFSIFAFVYVNTQLVRMSDELRYLLSFILIFILYPLTLLLVIRWLNHGPKIAATPILLFNKSPQSTMEGTEISKGTLVVKEVFDTYQRITDPAMGISSDLYSWIMKELVRNKFTLCEEGIVLIQMRLPILYKWSQIYSPKADPDNKRFTFKAKGLAGTRSFNAPNNFEEVRRVLSEHLQIR